MEIKKKIAVWCALFALLVALVPSSSAKANEVQDIGDYTWSYVADKVPDNIKSMFEDKAYVFYRIPLESSVNAGKWFLCMREWFVATEVYVSNDNLIFFNNNNTPVDSCTLYCFDTSSDSWVSSGTVMGAGVMNVKAEIVACKYNTIYGSNAYNVIDKSLIYLNGVPTFEESLVGAYDFRGWCIDAGLLCGASSNESASVIPYSYNDYWHIVRKTSSGKWLLTTIGNSVMAENLSDYTMMYSEDMGRLQVYNLYSGEDAKGYLLNIRQYEYDTDGWRLKSYVTEDSRDTDDCIIDLGARSGVDDTRIIAYTSTDIYDEGFNLVTPASTEYVEPTTPEVTPEPTPEPTPDAGSGGDSSDSGGTGSDGGGTGGGTRPETNVDLGVDLDDITLKDIPETIKNIKDTIKEFLGLVGVVPLMIGAVFGFLPDWCLWVLGVSFAFVGILLIVKLIRG